MQLHLNKCNSNADEIYCFFMEAYDSSWHEADKKYLLVTCYKQNIFFFFLWCMCFIEAIFIFHYRIEQCLEIGIKLLSQPHLVVWSFVNKLLPAPFQLVFLGGIPIKLPKLHYQRITNLSYITFIVCMVYLDRAPTMDPSSSPSVNQLG